MRVQAAFIPQQSIVQNLLMWLIPGALFVTEILLSNAVSNHPLMDDWFYSSSVDALLNGRFMLSSWNEALALPSIFFGFLWSKLFGFSYAALHSLTLFEGLLGVLFFEVLCLEIGATPLGACVATTLLASNPLYLHLSCTFMTDIAFTMFSLIAVLWGLRYSRTKSRSEGIAFSALSVLSALTRQFGMAVPLAFLCNNIIAFKRFRGLNLWMPTILTATSIAAAYAITASVGQTPLGYTPHDRVLGILHRIHHGLAVQNIALYMSEALFFAAPLFFMECKTVRCFFYTNCLAVLLTLAFFATNTLTLETAACCFSKYGLGPVWLWDTDAFPGSSGLPTLPPLFYRFATYISCFVFSSMLIYLRKNWSTIFNIRFYSKRILIFVALIYAGGVALVTDANDRYVILVFTMALGLGSTNLRSLRDLNIVTGTVILGSIIGSSAFSICAVHDYHSWNRARWALIETLSKSGVASDDLDGGYEFNDITNYSKPHQTIFVKPTSFHKYLVAFHCEPNQQIVAKARYDTWLFPANRTMFALQSNNLEGAVKLR